MSHRAGGHERRRDAADRIADATEAKVAEANRETRAVLTATFDLDAAAEMRASWGISRDRLPELCSAIATLDGPA